MRHKLLLVVSLAVFSAGWCTGQEKSITVKGHALGEPLDCAKMTPQTRPEWKVVDGHIVKVQPRACVSGTDWQEDVKQADQPDMSFTYKAGKLVKMTFTFYRDSQSVLFDATQKFGKPTKSDDVEVMNAFGAKWSDQIIKWQSPAGYVSLYVDNNPTRPCALLQIMTLTEHDADVEKSQRKGTLD